MTNSVPSLANEIPFAGPVQLGRWQVTPTDYHADRECVSRSMLDDFIESPRLFHGKHIARDIPREETPAMALGTALHMAMDGGAEFAVWPDKKRRYGKVWDAFQAEHSSKTILRQSEFNSVRRMTDSLLAVPFVADLLSAGGPGSTEVAFRWTDQPTGLACRCMCDFLYGGYALDFKTAANPDIEAWTKQAAIFGLHRQVAFYLHGLDQCEVLPTWYFVVVGNKPPHDVHLLQPARRIIDFGAMQVRTAMRELRRRLDADNWLLDDHNLINPMDYPEWAFR